MQPFKQLEELKQSGDIEGAKQLILTLLDEHPDEPRVYIEAGKIHKQSEMMPQAITYFNQALEMELSNEERKQALFHLGASYRAVGLYDQAKETFEIGMSEYPSANEFYVYFATVLYNLDETDLAMEILLTKILETTKDEGVQAHRDEFQFYASRLDELFN